MGDVVHLEPGDVIPVDGILIDGFNVKCDESWATGESDVIRKRSADEVVAAIRDRQDTTRMDPFIISGSKVVEGVGTFHGQFGRCELELWEDSHAAFRRRPRGNDRYLAH